MGFCRVEDIGGAATISTVRAVTQVFEHHDVYLYDERDWRIDTPALHYIPGPSGVDIRDVEIWVQHRLVQNARRPTQVHKFDPDRLQDGEQELTLTTPPRGFEFDWITVVDRPPIRGVHIHAVVGCAELVPVGPQEEITQLKIGDSIIRNGQVIEEIEDEPALDGDIWLKPPEVLRLAAITIGRRMIEETLVMNTFAPSRFIASWEQLIEEYS